MKARSAKLVEGLLEGRSVREVADEIGVSRRHAFRLLAEPGVRERLDQATEQMVQGATRTLRRGAESAAQMLIDMAEGRRWADPGRVSACKAILAAAGVAKGEESDRIKRAVEERLQQLVADAEARALATPPDPPRLLTAVAK
jgi:AcrR family transcriptional regulator